MIYITKLIFLVGLPASGKSTYAQELKQMYNANIHSSDDLRVELFGDVNENSKNDVLFKELHKRIKNDLKSGKSVIYDATSINYKKRMEFLREIKDIECEKNCYLFATPFQDCLFYNSQRDRVVPEHVMFNMYKNFYIPQYYEGWDKISIVWNFDTNNFNIDDLFNGENGLNQISQDNPYHKYTIGEHCMRATILADNDGSTLDLILASAFHDIGKRETKAFKNSKGNPSIDAHYYQHHLVSAYNAMFYLKQTEHNDILNICNLIQWHMQLYFMDSDKAIDKFKRLVGEECYSKLLLLHKYDKASQ